MASTWPTPSAATNSVSLSSIVVSPNLSFSSQ
jgi:hypothetical protein